MKNLKHTPGPWIYSANANFGFRVDKADNENFAPLATVSQLTHKAAEGGSKCEINRSGSGYAFRFTRCVRGIS